MLNELHALSKALSEMDIQTKIWHREYKQLPNATAKAPCYKILISEKGGIKAINEIPPETVKKIRKFGNNQASFPAFNIRPLYRIVDENQKKALEGFEKNLSTFQLSTIRPWLTNDNWIKSMKSIDGAIKDMSNRMLKVIENSNNQELQVIIRLIQAVSIMPGGLRASLELYILSKLEKREDLQIFLSFLLNCGNENKSATDDMGKSISVMLDLAEWEDYGYPVASESMTNWINDALINFGEEEDIETVIRGHDAFGVLYNSDWKEPMPSVKLPGFDVTLRAMFHEQRCQQRYGEFNDGSYPIAKESRTLAKQALEWMAEQEHEGVTWKRADKDEIVFAYPSKLISTTLRCASIFGSPIGEKGENIEHKARFEKCAEDFLKSINGVLPDNLPEYIRVFSVRKMDKARTKVVLTRNCTPGWFVEAAKCWQTGCQNIPGIEFVEPETPFPLDVARIVNNVWKRDGKQIAAGKNIVKRMQYYQGIELLLDLPGTETKQNNIEDNIKAQNYTYDLNNDDVARNYLRILLTNTEGLIDYIGNSVHSGVYMSPYYATIIAKITAVIGLLIYKAGQRKEDYMQNTAYLLGQMLKAADELHTFYCKVERDGDVPQQLAGNSMFAFAAETPLRALAQISLRMMPYLSWARRYSSIHVKRNDVANGLVGWNLGLFEDICTNLSLTLNESIRFTEYDKAQLFLGYLAAFPKRDKTDNDLNTNKTKDN